jgi:hypothetical protein
MHHHEAILVDLLRRLEFWGFPTPLEYNTDIILASLLPSYDDFIACYLMLRVLEPMKNIFDMLMKVGDGSLTLE